jgi:hypothetical protein
MNEQHIPDSDAWVLLVLTLVALLAVPLRRCSRGTRS